MSKGNRIKIAFFGAPKNLDRLKSHVGRDWEMQEFDTVYCDEETDIHSLIVVKDPDLFCSFGDYKKYSNLKSMPFAVTSRWIHFEKLDFDTCGKTLMDFYINISLGVTNLGEISIVTPVFNIKEDIWITYDSLKKQTLKDWEWILIDDSTDNETYGILKSIESSDCRVKVFKNKRNTGNIGEIKRYGFELASYPIVAELDHDDELTDQCLEWVSKTFKKYPEAGMCYTDCSCVYRETGECLTYGDTFAFDYGSYRTEKYKGRDFLVTNYPNLNSITIRHIVGVPNHIRAWRKSVYNSVGGHNKKLRVVDDYELIIRTFLKSKIAHIPKFGYIQNTLPQKSNTTDVRRKEIQRLVKFIQEYYDKNIHNRILELGEEDFVWQKEIGRSDIYKNYEIQNQNFCIISDVK